MRIPAASARATASGRGRVEVADRERDLEAERLRLLEPTVRGDDGGAARDGAAQRADRAGLPRDNDHHDFVRHAFLRWHYPDQVLRVGGAVSRPLSPVARAPRYVPGIVARLRRPALGSRR